MPQIDEQEIVFEPLEELYAAGDLASTGDVPDQVIQPDEPAPSNVTNNEPTQVSRETPSQCRSGCQAAKSHHRKT